MNIDYFLNTRDYYVDLAKNKGKKFYKDLTKFLSDNIDELDNLRMIINFEITNARLIFEFWYGEYFSNPLNPMFRIRYIYSLIEYRRYIIMSDIVHGNQPPNFQKLKGLDLEIVKSLAKGELNDIIEGKTRLPHVLLQPNNTNRPPKM
jgi:hypothetical protein